MQTCTSNSFQSTANYSRFFDHVFTEQWGVVCGQQLSAANTIVFAWIQLPNDLFLLFLFSLRSVDCQNPYAHTVLQISQRSSRFSNQSSVVRGSRICHSFTVSVVDFDGIFEVFAWLALQLTVWTSSHQLDRPTGHIWYIVCSSTNRQFYELIDTSDLWHCQK